MGEESRVLATARLMEAAVRQFGDDGAQTFQRYFTQFQYTAFWCIRMLRPAESIVSVTPEVVDDVVIERLDCVEIHQVKTRDESRGAWTVAEILPILCAQFLRRSAFQGLCRVHFVSNATAETRPSRAPNTVSLFTLKRLIEDRRQGIAPTQADQKLLDQFSSDAVPAFVAHMLNAHKVAVPVDEMRAFILDAVIDTCSERLHYPARMDIYDPMNIQELAAALDDGERLPHYQLRAIYERLLLLVLGKVLGKPSDRRIVAGDVAACETSYVPDVSDAGLVEAAPGASKLEKKMFLGGFDATEIKLARRTRMLAEARWKELAALGLSNSLDWLSIDLLEAQQRARDRLCRVEGQNGPTGPRILEAIRGELSQLPKQHLPEMGPESALFAAGLLWRDTDRCYARWDGEVAGRRT